MIRQKRYTLTYIETRVREVLADTTVGSYRWTAAQYQEALNQAIEDSWPHWWELDMEDGAQVIVASTYEYDIPYFAEEVIAVTLEQGASEPYRRLQEWEVLGDVLYLPQERNQKYTAGKKLRIYYLRTPRVLRELTQADGVVAAGTLTTLTSTLSTFQTDEVQPGDRVRIDLATDEIRVVTSVTSETVLMVDLDMAAGTTLTFHINQYSTVPLAFLVHRAAYYLFMRDGHEGAGRDIEESMAWSQFHFDMSEYLLDRLTRSRPPKRSGL